MPSWGVGDHEWQKNNKGRLDVLIEKASEEAHVSIFILHLFLQEF